jgi:hypothetical protein
MHIRRTGVSQCPKYRLPITEIAESQLLRGSTVFESARRRHAWFHSGFLASQLIDCRVGDGDRSKYFDSKTCGLLAPVPWTPRDSSFVCETANKLKVMLELECPTKRANDRCTCCSRKGEGPVMSGAQIDVLEVRVCWMEGRSP